MSNQAAECKAAAERARHMRSQLSPMPPVAGGTSPIAGPRSPGATALQGSGAWPAQAVTQLFVSNLPKAYSKGELCADFAGFGTIAEVGARVVSREPQDSVRAWSGVLRLSSVVLDPSPSTPTPPAVFPSSRMSPGAPAPSRLLPASPPTATAPARYSSCAMMEHHALLRPVLGAGPRAGLRPKRPWLRLCLLPRPLRGSDGGGRHARPCTARRRDHELRSRQPTIPC